MQMLLRLQLQLQLRLQLLLWLPMKPRQALLQLMKLPLFLLTLQKLIQVLQTRPLLMIKSHLSSQLNR